MSKLKLTLACWDYDRTRPLIDGRVRADDIDLKVEVLRPREAFPRMLEKKEFHVSELSLASYVTLKARGDCPFVAIPVALSRMFRHSCIYVRADAGIKRPQDLKGKRVGTTQYGSTAVVYMRGLLEHDYGVRAEDMHWHIGGLDNPTPRPLVPLKLPEKIRVDFLSQGQTLEGMLEAGELDALFSIYIPPIFLKGSPRIVRLFPDYKEVEKDYFRRTGIYPIIHTVVIRGDVHKEHPWAAANLYKAFCEARDLAVDGLYDTDALRLSLPWLIDHVEEARRTLGKDYWAYGLDPNRKTLEALGRYAFEQGLAPRVVAPGELFPPDLV